MILLDTHAWIWWLAQPQSLSPLARQTIDAAAEAGGIAVSSISVWELALLAHKKRLGLSVSPGRWVEQCEALPFLTFVPVDNAIALRSVELGPTMHADPADRMILATALVRGMSLVSKDERLRESGLVPVVW